MSWLLHRDTCAGLIRGSARVGARLTQHLGQVHVSAVTIAVLELWLLRSRIPARYLQGYQALFQQVTVVPVDDPVAHRAASIGLTGRAQRPPLTLVHMLVAATAVIHGFTLVTRDTQLFANVPGLTVVDWFIP